MGVFFGWREDKKDWRAYYAAEVTAKGSLKAGFKITFSAGEMFLHIPSSLLDYIGDIGATVELEGGVSLKGSMEHKAYAKSAGGKRENATGKKIQVEFFVGLEISVYAKVGASSIFGAEATGTVKPEVKLEAEVEWEDGKCEAKLDPKLEPCSLQFKVTTTALLVKCEKEWKIELWKEQKLWEPAKKWEIYDHSKEGHAE